MSKTTGVVSINVAGRKRRPAPLRTKDFLSVLDLRPDEFDRVLDLAATIKRGRADGETGPQTLAGKSSRCCSRNRRSGRGRRS